MASSFSLIFSLTRNDLHRNQKRKIVAIFSFAMLQFYADIENTLLIRMFRSDCRLAHFDTVEESKRKPCTVWKVPSQKGSEFDPV